MPQAGESMIDLNEIQSGYVSARVSVLTALIEDVNRAEAKLQEKKKNVKDYWAETLQVVEREIGEEGLSERGYKLIQREDGGYSFKEEGQENDCEDVEKPVLLETSQ
jgi:outer membrane lipoprotein-sorting protein